VKAGWSTTRPNGQPVEPGTLCWITDLEDGTFPIATYGRTEAEIIEKLARQNANAQIALVRRASVPPAPGTMPAAPPAAPVRFRLSADQVMQYTEDLKNPAKSSEAVTMLQAHERGVDPQDERRAAFRAMGEAWERDHPEFYAIKPNRTQMGFRVGKITNGDPRNASKEIFTQAYHELLNEGLLVEEPEQQQQPQPTTTPSPFPGESPVQPAERPRRMFSTGSRSSSFSTPQRTSAPPRTLKYSEMQIRTMPVDESDRLLRAKDQDYIAAVRHFYPVNQQRTA
jgi:hypothetical protein